MRATKLILIAACLLASVCSVEGQGKPRRPVVPRGSDEVVESLSLRGRVILGGKFEPAQRVQVKLVNVVGAPISTAVTDERGGFEFLNLARAVYVVQVQEEGYEPVQERVDMHNGSRGDTVLVLEAPARVAKDPGGHVRSVRELRIPAKAQGEFDKGMAQLYGEDQPERSLQHFRKAIELYLDFDAAYVQGAVAQLRMGNLAAAEKFLQDGVARNAEYAPAQALLGTVFNAQGRHGEAVTVLQRAVALGLASWQVEYELGKAYTKLADLDSALEHARRAQELKPDAAEPLLQLYNVRIHRRDYGEALALLEAFLQKYPEHAAAAQMRDAEADLRKAAESASNRP